MARPEGETTRILRDTMNWDIQAVNTKLIDAGEQALEPEVLRKRRNAIRSKDAKRKPKSSKKPPQRKTAVAARKRLTKKARKQPSATEPRPGSFAHFVWNQPYDLDAKTLLARAKAANIRTGSASQMYNVRNTYPRPKIVGTPKLNEIATSSALQDLNAVQRGLVPQAIEVQQIMDAELLSKLLAETPNDKQSQQFALLIVNRGVDWAQRQLAPFLAARDHLQAAVVS